MRVLWKSVQNIKGKKVPTNQNILEATDLHVNIVKKDSMNNVLALNTSRLTHKAKRNGFPYISLVL